MKKEKAINWINRVISLWEKAKNPNRIQIIRALKLKEKITIHKAETIEKESSLSKDIRHFINLVTA